MSSKSSLAFNILGFSTNSDTFTPLKIIEKFISNSEYSDEFLLQIRKRSI